jgi:hypothetical protein
LLRAGADGNVRDSEGVTALGTVRSHIDKERTYLDSLVSPEANITAATRHFDEADESERYFREFGLPGQVDRTMAAFQRRWDAWRNIIRAAHGHLDDLERLLAEYQGMGGTSLRCAGCGREYNIGDNAVAASMEYRLSLAMGSAAGGGFGQEDLIPSVEGVTGDAREAALERGRPSWKVIEESLARGGRRRWRCRACNAVNAYPHRG